MKLRTNIRRVLRSGFTLVEILVVMALLTVIILGLMATFNQTQRAFKLGMMQTDVLESGRLGTDMITRELTQMTPSYTDPTLNPLNPPWNFYVLLDNRLPDNNTSVQTLPGGSQTRLNLMEDLFFMNRENQTWTGIGYFVRTNDEFPLNEGRGRVGTLYRYETNNSAIAFLQNPSGPFAGFDRIRNGPYLTNGVSKILDGVMHFRLRAFDTNGIEIAFTNSLPPPIPDM